MQLSVQRSKREVHGHHVNHFSTQSMMALLPWTSREQLSYSSTLKNQPVFNTKVNACPASAVSDTMLCPLTCSALSMGVDLLQAHSASSHRGYLMSALCYKGSDNFAQD